MSESQARSAQDFHDTVLTSLTRLETISGNIAEQLRKLNGTIQEHTKLIAQLDHDLDVHSLTCPLKDQVSKLSITLSEQNVARDAAARTHRKWYEVLKPAIFGLAGIVIYILLKNADELMSKFF